MGRAPCCDKANVKKGPWSPEEDAKLKSYMEEHGSGGNWIALPQKMGLKRCGKSCRLRWLNYLRPNIKHGGFTDEEDHLICSLYINIGSRWSIIAAQLPGRTDNDIKNYWNTKLKKKLLGKQRKDLDLHYSSAAPKHKRLALDGNNTNHLPIVLPNSNFNDQVMIPPHLPLMNHGLPNVYDQTMYNHHPQFPSTNTPQITNHLMDTLAFEDVPSEIGVQPMTSEYNLDGCLNQGVVQGDANNNLGGSISIPCATTSTNFPAELEELMSSKPTSHGMIDGLDFMAWEDEVMINGNASGGDQTSCRESYGGSWGEMSSFVPLPMAGVPVANHGFNEFRYN